LEGFVGASAPFNACGVHPGVSATFTCSRCGTFGCESCLDSMRPMPLCHACAALGINAVPWERREQLGVWKAFWETSKEACLTPTAFYQRSSIEGLNGGPLYGIAVYTLSQMLFMVQFALVYMVMGAVVGATGGGDAGVGLGIGMGFVGCIMVPIVGFQAPIAAVFSMAFALAGGHLSLMAMQQRGATWEDTLRGVGYSNAAYLWMAVPCIGWLIAPFALVWNETVALREIHQTTTLVALAAVLLWRLLIIAVFITLYALLFATMLQGFAPQ
jgi:hypothetical protein